MFLYDESKLNIIKDDLRYLKLLSKQYPTISTASTEIINLKAILSLPKGTEHFISDVHGEYESFTHMLKNASGVIKRKIDDVFGNSLTDKDKKKLATLIYYPEQKMELMKNCCSDLDDWYKVTLYKLIRLCQVVSSKYTRSKVRKSLPKDFAYIIEELLNDQGDRAYKQEYYNGIIQTIVDINRSCEFIIALSNVIQKLVVDRLHIIGDIYDRGPGADIILDALEKHHSVDIQWGNHDIVWMGAASGSDACIANVLRVSLRYANLKTLEDGYGINLLPLATFAMDFYQNDDCSNFIPRTIDKELTRTDLDLLSKMHKAISIIQFKLEGQIIKRRPEFNMEHRLILNKINLKDKTVTIEDKVYNLSDSNFPTLDLENPYKLNEREYDLIKKLRNSFLSSEKFQRHIRFLYSHGGMYTVYNSNLLYHGCIPLNDDGSFKEVVISNERFSGKPLLDKIDQCAREAFFFKNDPESKLHGMDLLWYLWCGSNSPLFGKRKMTTFERYFINEKSAHQEDRNAYYKYRNNETMCLMIFKEFDLDPNNSHIINGHIPVKTKEGESPIKANGKLLVIDGGFCKAYQPQTGIAGYTLIYNSYGLLLTSHEPFDTIKKAIEEDNDIISSTIILEHVSTRKRVLNTDIGKEIKKQIYELEMLLSAYRKGLIKEQR